MIDDIEISLASAMDNAHAWEAYRLSGRLPQTQAEAIPANLVHDAFLAGFNANMYPDEDGSHVAAEEWVGASGATHHADALKAVFLDGCLAWVNFVCLLSLVVK